MASTNSTIDGMGFEELGQVGSQPYNTWIAGSFTADVKVTTGSVIADEVQIAGGLSVPVAIITTGSFTQTRATNYYSTQGQLYSVQAGSPVAYNGFVKAGSLITNAGSQGFVKFGNSFSSEDGWYVNLTPVGSATSYEKSYVSGLRHASGINMVGAANLRYDWTAIGINT